MTQTSPSDPKDTPEEKQLELPLEYPNVPDSDGEALGV